MEKFRLNKFKLADDCGNYEPKLLNYLNEKEDNTSRKEEISSYNILRFRRLRILIEICAPDKVSE